MLLQDPHLGDVPQVAGASRWALGADGVPRLIQTPLPEVIAERPAARPVASSTRPSFAQSCLRLIGHLSATALVSVTVFGLGWVVALAVRGLDCLYRFAPGIVQVLSRPQVWLVDTDAVLTGIVLVCGIVRFARGV